MLPIRAAYDSERCKGMMPLVAMGMTAACDWQDGIPPFRWTPAFNSVEHRGQPEVFDSQAFERQAPDVTAFSHEAAGAI